MTVAVRGMSVKTPSSPIDPIAPDRRHVDLAGGQLDEDVDLAFEDHQAKLPGSPSRMIVAPAG